MSRSIREPVSRFRASRPSVSDRRGRRDRRAGATRDRAFGLGAQVAARFDKIAARIEGYMKRFYLLSYCSPSRAGEHELKVEPVTTDGAKGDLTYCFNAAGFGRTAIPIASRRSTSGTRA